MSTAVVIPLHKQPRWGLFDAIPDDVAIYCVDDSPAGDIWSPRSNVTFVRSDARYGRRSSASRNAGHLAAYRDGHEVIIALDSDCQPGEDWVADHLSAIGRPVTKVTSAGVFGGWIDTLGLDGWYARGFPYERRRSGHLLTPREVSGEIRLNMGLWRGTLDLNAIDRVLREDVPTEPYPLGAVAAKGTHFPICGMNVAFAAELLPAYFFLPDVEVEGWPLSRHDDIWGGYILKQLMDKVGDLASFGAPLVEHVELSNRERALVREHWMHLLARGFYACVDEAISAIKPGSYREMFAAFVARFHDVIEFSGEPRHYRETYHKLADHMGLWIEAFA